MRQSLSVIIADSWEKNLLVEGSWEKNEKWYWWALETKFCCWKWWVLENKMLVIMVGSKTIYFRDNGGFLKKSSVCDKIGYLKSGAMLIK